MKRIITLLTIVTIVALTLLIIFSKDPITVTQNDIAATIFPIYDITKNIAGDTLEVGLILPAGASPHTYEPTPSDISSLQNTSAIYVVGLAFDDWATTIADSTDAQLVEVNKNVNLYKFNEQIRIDDDEIEDEHNHDEYDPHFWLSIENAKIIAQNIANDLSVRYPEHSDTFTLNLDNYLKELDLAELEMNNILQGVQNKNLITMHDAWYYFAKEYGFEIAGSFEPTAGREPTPQYLVQLTSAIQQVDVSVIYTEPQFDSSNLESFIKDNNLEIAILDPIGAVEGRNSYIELMLYNAKTIAQNQ